MQDPAPVVDPQYCVPYVTEFTVIKKAMSLSGGDFVVNDSNGDLFFRVEGSLMSIRGRRVLQDRQGNALLSAMRKILTLHDTWLVHRGGSDDNEANRLFTVRRSAIWQIRASLDVFLASNSSENEPDYNVKGNYLERKCTVFHGNSTVAEVRRKFTASNVLLGKDTFVITVFPGIDHAFVVMLIVLMDEIQSGKHDCN